MLVVVVGAVFTQALLICTKGVWGLGKPKSGQIWPCFVGPTPPQEGFREAPPAGLENRHDEGSVWVWFWGAVSGDVEAVWDGRWQFF